jgi:hypothetical protein
MAAFIKFAGHTKILGISQPARALRFFSASSVFDGTWSKDPETRREQYDRRNARARERYAQDSVYREERKEASSTFDDARSDDDVHFSKQRHAFSLWVQRLLRRGVARPWEGYTPEWSLASKATARCCWECGQYRRKNLWWQRKNEPNSYIVRLTTSSPHKIDPPGSSSFNPK